MTPLSRNHVVENGEHTRLACAVPRPRGTARGRLYLHRLVTGGTLPPTGEGAGRDTRGRVCSPIRTAWLRLRFIALVPEFFVAALLLVSCGHKESDGQARE